MFARRVEAEEREREEAPRLAAAVDAALLVHHMRSPTTGVAVKDRKLPSRSKPLRECFLGKDAVEWLLAPPQAPHGKSSSSTAAAAAAVVPVGLTRATAVVLLERLRREGYLKPVGPGKRTPRPIDCDLTFFRFSASSHSGSRLDLRDEAKRALKSSSGGGSGGTTPKTHDRPRHDSVFLVKDHVSREFESWLEEGEGEPKDPEQEKKSHQELRFLFKTVYDIVLKQASIDEDEVQQAMQCMDDLCRIISLVPDHSAKAGMTKERLRAIVFGLGGMYILTGLLRRLRPVAPLQRKGSELVSLLLGDISSKQVLSDVEAQSILPLIRTLGKTYHLYGPWSDSFDGQTWNEVNGALDILYNKGWRQEVARMRNKRLIKIKGRFYTFGSQLNKERLWERPLAVWDDTRRSLLEASRTQCTIRLWSIKVEDVLLAKELAVKVQQWPWNGQPAKNQPVLWSSATKNGRWDIADESEGDAFDAHLYQELRINVYNRRREESVFRKAKEDFVGAIRIEPATVHALLKAYGQESLEVSMLLSREEETPSGPRYHSGSQLKRGRMSLRMSIHPSMS